MKLRVLELFAGIGACSKALKNIGIDIDIVDAVEIDKYAIQSFNAIHNTNFLPQDIKKWDKDLKDIGLIMHGSPCQDFSIAGKQAGGDINSNTRSSLMYETIKIVEKIRPRYVLWENVKNLLSKKHKHNFDAYIDTMSALGYNSYYEVLNAKDYEIPQNRERVYTISIRKDIDKGNFKFPKKEELKLRLKDMLEDEVDEKYYLSDEQTKRIETTTYNSAKKRVQEKEYCDTPLARDYKDPKCVVADYRYDEGLRVRKEQISPCLTTKIGSTSLSGNTLLIKNNTKKGYLEAEVGDGVYTNTSNKRGTVQKGMIQTLATFQDKGVVVEKKGVDITWNKIGDTTDVSRTLSKNQMSTGILEIGNYSPSKHNASRIVDSEGLAPTVMENHGTVTATNTNLRIRKLTPLECWRLMGFDDADFYKAQSVGVSNTQLYKQAGNSICVAVLEKIFINLFKEVQNDNKRT